MRRTLLLLANVTLLAGLAGCQTVTGQCDCVDNPAGCHHGPAHPGVGVEPGPADMATLPPPSAKPAVKADKPTVLRLSAESMETDAPPLVPMPTDTFR